MNMQTEANLLPTVSNTRNIGVSEKFLVKLNESETLSAPTLLWSPQSNFLTTRIFYSLAGLSFLTLLYFTFRAFRLRRRRDKVRRYGVIASREDVEMTPLENKDDDEDATVFDVSLKNLGKS